MDPCRMWSCFWSRFESCECPQCSEQFKAHPLRTRDRGAIASASTPSAPTARALCARRPRRRVLTEQAAGARVARGTGSRQRMLQRLPEARPRARVSSPQPFGDNGPPCATTSGVLRELWVLRHRNRSRCIGCPAEARRRAPRWQSPMSRREAREAALRPQHSDALFIGLHSQPVATLAAAYEAPPRWAATARTQNRRGKKEADAAGQHALGVRRAGAWPSTRRWASRCGRPTRYRSPHRSSTRGSRASTARSTRRL
eukprot:scaffold12999_cov112-Isochrysis_galbana.AAC.2